LPDNSDRFIHRLKCSGTFPAYQYGSLPAQQVGGFINSLGRRFSHLIEKLAGRGDSLGSLATRSLESTGQASGRDDAVAKFWLNRHCNFFQNGV
jgi:hypothetical protein